MRDRISRGKRVDNNEWVEGFYVNVPEHYKQEMSGKSYIVSINNGLFMEVVPESVGDYMGLTDKNGKRIFEGDIVRYRHEFWQCPMQSVVEYCADKWNYPAFDLKDNDYEEANGLQLAHEMEIEFEVIGNIHDNPELLEVENEKI